MRQRLQLLITIQKEREEKLQGQFIKAQQFYQQAEQQYQGLATYRSDYIKQSQQQGSVGLQSRQFNQFLNFIAKLDQALQQQGKAVQQARAAAEQRKQSWLAMQKKRKAFELLIQRADEAELQKLLKQEQKMADEFASQQYFRQQLSEQV